MFILNWILRKKEDCSASAEEKETERKKNKKNFVQNFNRVYHRLGIRIETYESSSEEDS